MNDVPAAAGSGAATAGLLPEQRPKRRVPKKLHGYFIAFTALFALLVLAGFWGSFFVPLASGTFSRPLVVHVHGALFFAWTAILVVQAVLAGTRRLRMHRRVGAIAGWLVLPMVMLGAVVAYRDTANDFAAGGGDERLSFFYGELADLAMFALLAGGAMLLRHKPDFHKRWVILGSLGLLGAAVGRIPGVGDWGFQIFVGLIASVALYDLASRRTIHIATVTGALVLLALNLTQGMIGDSPIWLAAAHRILSV